MWSVRNLVGDVAGAIADQEPIDWNLVRKRASRDAEAEIRQLQTISRLATAPSSTRFETERTTRSPVWLRVWLTTLMCLASSHVVVALVRVIFSRSGDDASGVPPLAPIVNMVAYWTIGGVLVVGGSRRDRRAWHLGAFFVLAASPLAIRFLPAVLSLPPSLRWWRGVYPETFTPLALWLFARDFPRLGHFTRYDLVARFFTASSAAFGTLLFAVNFARMQNFDGPWAVLARGQSGPYWAILFTLQLSALPIIVLRARTANRDEHRRVGLFLGGLVVGGLPILLQVLLAVTIPPYFDWLTEPRHLYIATFIVFGFSALVPLTSAYAVLVDRLFDLRPILRRAFQYALARYTVLAITCLPLVLLGWSIVSRREDADPLSSTATVLSVTGLAVVAIIWIAAERRLFDWINRRFFLPEVDTRAAMAHIGARLMQVSAIREVADLLVDHATRALGVDRAVVLARREGQPAFIPLSGTCRPLPITSAIACLTSVATSPVNLDWEAEHSIYRLLPPEDREWIVDAACTLIIPVPPMRQPYTALLLVGRKRSELPFTRDEHLFLESVASSAALGLENASYRETESSRPGLAVDWNDEAAAECTICGVVRAWGSDLACGVCSGALRSAALPAVLLGKFKVAKVLGKGGMGIVYLGEDLTLGRDVAIKTLPRVSVRQVNRLRAEARAMAAVTHPNLAVIYGAEMWRGTPLLIVEYLAGGTLSDRLAERSLSLEEMITLGEAMAGAIDRMHRTGMLHRDVKPSNVGYSSDGTPKLLDFGLARLLGGTARETLTSKTLLTSKREEIAQLTGVTHLSGTPLYLSPEAIVGTFPDESVDLWSLSVMLFEAITGSCPFQGTSVPQVFARIRGADADVLCKALDGHPRTVGDFFRRSLAREASRRFQSAGDFSRGLSQMRATLAS